MFTCHIHCWDRMLGQLMLHFNSLRWLLLQLTSRLQFFHQLFIPPRILPQRHLRFRILLQIMWHVHTSCLLTWSFHILHRLLNGHMLRRTPCFNCDCIYPCFVSWPFMFTSFVRCSSLLICDRVTFSRAISIHLTPAPLTPFDLTFSHFTSCEFASSHLESPAVTSSQLTPADITSFRFRM